MQAIKVKHFTVTSVSKHWYLCERPEQGICLAKYYVELNICAAGSEDGNLEVSRKLIESKLKTLDPKMLLLRHLTISEQKPGLQESFWYKSATKCL